MARAVHALGCKTVVFMQVPVGEGEQKQTGVLLWP